MISFRATLLAGTALALGSTGQAAAFDGVVASIKPVHSLVAAVMEGVGEPSLIVSGAGSPHTYSMRPSEAQMLESASLVFWVGHDLEMFLDGPLDTLAGNATIVELGDAEGLTKLGYREGGPFDSHAHGDAEESAEAEHDHAHESAAHHDDDAHAHADDDDGAQPAAAADTDDHAHDSEAGHEGHDHGAFDMHMWLDPENAKIMVGEIETALSVADPDNAATYAQNADAVTARLDTLIADTRTQLDALDNRGFVVFHDAYQYYENRFGIAAAGSITVSPEAMPGAQRLSEIQARVRELNAACVFAEPQFEPRLIDVVIEGTDAKAGVLDPLGAELEDGPELYFELMSNLTTSLTTCLSGKG